MSHSQTVTPPLAAIDGHDVQVEYCDHEEQHQIQAAEYALEMGLVGLEFG